MSDSDVREIHLSGKQLFFLFMASVVVAVAIFLLGVSVGRGVKTGTLNATSALSGYTFGFWALMAGGVLLFLIAPLIQKLMHGVK